MRDLSHRARSKGLYVHIPFCVKKCAYCDFYSLPGKTNLINDYVNAILREAQAHQNLSFQTLFLGGGTPSLLGPGPLTALIDGLGDTFDLSHLEEATIEVNPDSATEALFQTAKLGGINRISVGVQSLSDGELQSVGRVHNAVQAIQSIELAKKYFDRVSADLIVGLPEQNWETLQESLNALVNIGVKHLSLYCLSLEHETPLALQPPADLPSEDTQADLFEQARLFLSQRGFGHYEISNFAMAGHECRHNINYWHSGEYLGLGPAAASHLNGKRYKNRADLEGYLRNPEGMTEDIEEMSEPDKAAEEAMLRLRLLSEGLNIEELEQKFGAANIVELVGRLKRLTEDGMLTCSGQNYRLAPSQVLTANHIFGEVLLG